MSNSIFEKRLSYKPFDYSEITDPLINAMWASHWTHNEFNFKSDVQDYHTSLTEEERGVIKRAILLISQVEVDQILLVLVSLSLFLVLLLREYLYILLLLFYILFN